MRNFICLLAGILLGSFSVVRADVALLMLETAGKGGAKYTLAGHSAVYLTSVCVETPVKLRMCKPGEGGSVISNYSHLDEVQPYEWNVAPANVFFYGVEAPAGITLYADMELKRALEERYRQKYLAALCPPGECVERGQWRDMVGATFKGDIYEYRVATTEAQDEWLVSLFNSEPNVNPYNFFTKNCSTFARKVLDLYFPGAAHRDVLNDFGMTSPKAIARSFAKFGRKHPELGYTVVRHTQFQGPIQRSYDVCNGTEVSFRARKWSIPLLLFHSHMLAGLAATYYLTGHFSPEHEYQTHHSAELSPAEERAAWNRYKKLYTAVRTEAFRDGLFARQKEINSFFRMLERNGNTWTDADGLPMLAFNGARVGLTRETILLPGSDPALAQRLMLAKVNASLRTSKKNRESLQEFQADWELLQELNKVHDARLSSSSRAQ